MGLTLVILSLSLFAYHYASFSTTENVWHVAYTTPLSLKRMFGKREEVYDTVLSQHWLVLFGFTRCYRTDTLKSQYCAERVKTSHPRSCVMMIYDTHFARVVVLPPPRLRRDYPLNLSISVSGGKETKRDSLSRGDRKGKSPAQNLPSYPACGGMLRKGKGRS